MIEVRRYIAGDAALIRPRAALAVEVEQIDVGFLEGGAVPPGPAYTVTDRMEPVGCGGLAPIWPGRFVAWTWMGDARPQVWRVLLSESRRQVRRAFEELGAYRVEASTKADFVRGRRWLENLGFTQEGIARSFLGDGLDYAVYARTLEDFRHERG